MDDLPGLIGQNLALIVLAVVILMAVASAVKIVPQSEKYVVERFGRLHSVLGPGINLTVPFLDRVAHRISVLERQLPTNSQDAITADNVLVQVETSVFYRIIEPEKPFTASATSMRPSPPPWLASCGRKSARWNWTGSSRTARN